MREKCAIESARDRLIYITALDLLGARFLQRLLPLVILALHLLEILLHVRRDLLTLLDQVALLRVEVRTIQFTLGIATD